MTQSAVLDDVTADEARVVEEFVTFLKTASFRRHPEGRIRRFNQGRAAGCVDAELVVQDGLSDELRVGLFAKPRMYRARVRFAHASSSSDRERDIRGMSVRVFNAPGPNVTAGVSVHDFVLNSHPVMPAADTREFLALLKAMEAGGFQRASYLMTHPRAALIGSRARQHHTCHLDIPYWSATPYGFGPDRAVKYVVRPMSSRRSARPASLTDTYLTDALRAHLAQEEAVFDVAVQFQAGSHMPLDDATAEWSELESPYRTVARLKIPSQAVSDGDANSCETIAFNPWHCHADQRPLGEMNRARRMIYEEMARFRAAENAQRGA